jgi:hypothetical protein
MSGQKESTRGTANSGTFQKKSPFYKKRNHPFAKNAKAARSMRVPAAPSNSEALPRQAPPEPSASEEAIFEVPRIKVKK